MMKCKIVLVLGFTLILFSCRQKEQQSNEQTAYHYEPDDKQLYQTIVHLDSVYFTAYNHCDMQQQADMYADSIEFYHDKGGLSTSKPELLESIRKNICGKVTRELVPGSIEVYPIKDFGAVEMGLHMFHNNEEKLGTPSKIGRFIIIWQHKNDTWKMSRIISLH